MSYKADYGLLCRIFNQNLDRIDIENRRGVIVNLPFNSAHSDMLPGPKEYGSLRHLRNFLGRSLKPQRSTIDDMLTVVDSRVMENSSFRHTIFIPEHGSKTLRDVIFLLHGFNEKNWHKYLPWALRLMESTGKTVLRYPGTHRSNQIRQPFDYSRRGQVRFLRILNRRIPFRALIDDQSQKSVEQIEALQFLRRELEKDTVIPGYEVVNTLKGTKRNIRIPVRIIDFPYDYSHVDPFLLSAGDGEVNKSFDRVLHTAARFLC